MTDLLFLAFAAVTIGAAILAIEARDLVYGAAALGIAFLFSTQLTLAGSR